MVDTVRKSVVVHDATSRTETPSRLKVVKAVGEVPGDFIAKIIKCEAMSEEDTIRGLQVTIHAYSDVVCRRLFDSVPKQVHLFLVDGICDGFVPWMLDKVDASDLQRWLAEDARSLRRRKE
ncbi:unnamed protein product, partial [Scytosiphon promiscuus]